MQDQALPANCVSVSTTPSLGMLYPLSNNLFVNGAGFVGMGTTSPTHRLHVAGGVMVDEDIEVNGGVFALGDVFGIRVRAAFGSVAEPSFRFSSTEATGFSSPAQDSPCRSVPPIGAGYPIDSLLPFP